MALKRSIIIKYLFNNFSGSYIGHDPWWHFQSAYNRKSRMCRFCFPRPVHRVAARYRRKSAIESCVSVCFCHSQSLAGIQQRRETNFFDPVVVGGFLLRECGVIVAHSPPTNTIEDTRTASPRSKNDKFRYFVRMKSLLCDFLALGFRFVLLTLARSRTNPILRNLFVFFCSSRKHSNVKEAANALTHTQRPRHTREKCFDKI